jgi:hypothetical protein
MRTDFGIEERKGLDDSRFHGNRAILVLQHASDKQERMMYNNAVVPFEELGRDDHVGNSRFIFEA